MQKIIAMGRRMDKMTDMSVRDKKKAETRQLLMASAVRVFHEKSIHDTRVSDIVSRAGVAQGTFYNYFPSKEALFKAIAEEYMAHYGELFRRYAGGLFEDGRPETLAADFGGFLRQLFVSCRDNIATARLVFGEGAGSTGPYQEVCESVIRRFIELIRGVLDRGREKGVLRFEDTELAATMIFGMFQRSMFYFLLTRKELDVDRLEKGMTAFLFGGLDVRLAAP
jgi:AcrR family transcriptional regulator